MTKSEWRNIKVGSKVVHKTWTIIEGKPVDIILSGSVIRINSNRSQVLVKWDSTDNEIWYGRLGLEINKPK